MIYTLERIIRIEENKNDELKINQTSYFGVEKMQHCQVQDKAYQRMQSESFNEPARTQGKGTVHRKSLQGKPQASRKHKKTDLQRNQSCNKICPMATD